MLLEIKLHWAHSSVVTTDVWNYQVFRTINAIVMVPLTQIYYWRRKASSTKVATRVTFLVTHKIPTHKQLENSHPNWRTFRWPLRTTDNQYASASTSARICIWSVVSVFPPRRMFTILNRWCCPFHLIHILYSHSRATTQVTYVRTNKVKRALSVSSAILDDLWSAENYATSNLFYSLFHIFEYFFMSIHARA